MKEKVFEDLVQVLTVIGSNEKKRFFFIGISLDANKRDKLAEFFEEKYRCIHLAPYDVPRILADKMCHKLYISPSYKSVKQKPWRSALEKAKIVEEEVQKLFKACAIKEAEFLEWISNPVVVRKKNGK